MRSDRTVLSDYGQMFVTVLKKSVFTGSPIYQSIYLVKSLTTETVHSQLQINDITSLLLTRVM